MLTTSQALHLESRKFALTVHAAQTWTGHTAAFVVFITAMISKWVNCFLENLSKFPKPNNYVIRFTALELLSVFDNETGLYDH